MYNCHLYYCFKCGKYPHFGQINCTVISPTCFFQYPYYVHSIFKSHLAGLSRLLFCLRSCCSDDSLLESTSPSQETTPLLQAPKHPITEIVSVPPNFTKSLPKAPGEDPTIKMAPGITSPVPGNLASSFYNIFNGGSRQVSAFSGVFDSDSISNNGPSSRREPFMPRKSNGAGNTEITSVVQSLYRRSGDELGATTSSKLLNSSYQSLMEWIRAQRMSHLPPEGSSYDKVLAWAQLFVERLHHFDSAIHEFAGDSYLATQLSYGYCGMLLDVRSTRYPSY